MKELSGIYNELLRLFIIAAAFIGAIVTTIFTLTHGMVEVFPFLYVVPIILLVYFYSNRGMVCSIVISAVYPLLVSVYSNYDPTLIIVSIAWFVVFITIGIVMLSFAKGLREDERKYQGIFENSQAGIFTFDLSVLRIHEVNEKFARMLRCERGDLLNKDLVSVMHDAPELDRFLSRIKMSENTGDIDLLCKAKDGATRNFLISASVTPENIVICTAIDITERKIAEQVIAKARAELETKVNERTTELRKANDELKGEIQERRRFESAIQLANRKLNTLSDITRHDILNQITAIVMYLSLAQENDNNPATADYLKKIESITQLIQKQIQFTRDYQNIGASAPQWQNVGVTISTTVADFDPHAVRIEMDLQDLEIFADLLLEKVFVSLIDNALRHGQKLTVIRFSCIPSGDDLILLCEDDGVGIPIDAKERIFKREYYRNTGYGLFLADEILSITGLSIRETGEPGRGARFEIYASKGTYRYPVKNDSN